MITNIVSFANAGFVMKISTVSSATCVHQRYENPSRFSLLFVHDFMIISFQNGAVYKHCKLCGKCVKNTWQHCAKCRICKLVEHRCTASHRNASEVGSDSKEWFSSSCLVCLFIFRFYLLDFQVTEGNPKKRKNKSSKRKKKVKKLKTDNGHGNYSWMAYFSCT